MSSSATPTPSSSSVNKRKTTPTAPGEKKKDGSKKKKIKQEKENVEKFRFLKPDSDDDSQDEESSSKKEWRMVDSKVDGKRYSKDAPTNPNHRYVGREINVRDDKPTPNWWTITKSLDTEKKMTRKSESETDNKLRDFYCKLAREVENNSESSQLTPLTPEIINSINSPLTADERKIAEDKIKAAGDEGLDVPDTNYKVMWKPANPQGRGHRSWGLFGLAGSKRDFICTADPNCVGLKGTTMEENPKCHLHKGEQLGFVLGQWTDENNMKNDVVLHAIASFTFTEGEEEGKEKHAEAGMKVQIGGATEFGWKTYKKEREALIKPHDDPSEDDKEQGVTKLVEIKEKRLYFNNEEDLMKRYAARQTCTLLQMLLWPDTTVKIICLNSMINFPNGAYKELLEEMNLCGMDLRVHDVLTRQAADSLELEQFEQIPFIIKADKGETLGSLLQRGNNLIDNKNSDQKKEQLAALYFVSSPYIIYGGQALTYNVHSRKFDVDPVVFYKHNKPSNHPAYQIVPLGLVLADERYKWEFILHIVGLLASLLKLPNCINPDQFSAQSHPICINKQANSTFVDKKSWFIVNGLMKKIFRIDVSLGPKANGDSSGNVE